MSQSNVISINPGRKTLGEMCKDDKRIIELSRALTSPGVERHYGRDFVNFLSGINGKINIHVSFKILALRMLCGGIFLYMSLMSILESGMAAVDMTAAIEGVLAISLILGIATRPLTLAAAGWYGYGAVMSIVAGMPDMYAMMMTVSMLVFSVMGPGKISVDQLMRRGLLALMRNKKRVDKGIEMDYRAYEMAGRRAV